MSSQAARHLFIAGCPRSGTSALTFLLNEHPQLVLGFERFKRTRAQLDPFHFHPAHFFAPLAAETDIRGALLYERLRARWDGGGVRVIGDKVPLYTRVLPQLLTRFPTARFVVLVRDPVAVASSFSRRASDPDDWWPAANDHTLAVRMWNEALAAVRAVETPAGADGNDGDRPTAAGRIALLPYEPFFAGEQRWLARLLAFIGVPATPRLNAEYRRMARATDAAAPPQTGELAAYVRAHIDGELAAWAHARIERELGLGAAADEPALADDPPLTDAQIGERERERDELLAQMRRPGRRDTDELAVLERRYVEQAGELARRGERLTCAAQPLSAERALRVTFLAPHQRATTGGVYAIEQFARHLAPDAQVCLAVRARPTRAVAGVELRWLQHGLAERDALPLADVLVYPADMRDAELIDGLPADAGAPVMLFQGYGTPGSPIVEANLAAARACVAIARWLVDLALARGTRCAYVPQGLDRGVFTPGPPQAQRAPCVTAMTHHLDWKGLRDTLEALALVRAERPDVEIVLFGVEPVAGVGTFVERPSRAQVAELLRASAVHVVASWEEGFGLTGAEALACGAALATTDTKGSRDYAIDRHTALVSAPRDPQALADNVLALLADAKLRACLVGAGQHHLRTAMPPWPEAARRMGFALRELVAEDDR